MAPANVKYGELWHKLKIRKPGGEFTTFRGYTPQKNAYYFENVGKTLGQELRGPRASFLGRARLLYLQYAWSNDLSLEFIQADTYPHYSRGDFNDEMKKFYKMTPVFGIILNMKWTEVVPSLLTT